MIRRVVVIYVAEDSRRLFSMPRALLFFLYGSKDMYIIYYVVVSMPLWS